MFMNTLDGCPVVRNVALPDIQKSLHFSQSGLTWVVDAYLITFGSFLLMAGRLGDLIGRKKVFLAGVTLFMLASIACGSADSQAMLVGARFVQGIGGALSSSVIVAIIVTEFPRPAERAKAMSAYVFVAVGGGSIGLLARGRPDPVPELALDLLREHPYRHRHARPRPLPHCGERRQPGGLAGGRAGSGLDPRHRVHHGGHLRHRHGVQ